MNKQDLPRRSRFPAGSPRLLSRPCGNKPVTVSAVYVRRLSSLVAATILLAGCTMDSARPGTVCGHCDYRFSYQTPNPCDPCVSTIELPCFGYTPTTWHPWPECCAHTPLPPIEEEPSPEDVPLPDMAPPPTPLPSVQTGRAFQSRASILPLR